MRRLIASLKAPLVRFVLRWCAPELIREICRGLLDRMPNATEAATYSAELRLGHDLDGVLRTVIESDEYQKKLYLSGIRETVQAGYRVLLGREPDPEGERTYTTFLKDERNFAPFFTALADSAEFKQRLWGRLAPAVVSAGYGQILGRESDPGGLAAGIASLAAPADLAPFLHRLIASEEYQHKGIRSHLPGLVRSAYLVFLRREPDPDGSRSYTDFLASTGDFGAFFSGISDSDEFRQIRRVSAHQDLECVQCDSLFNDTFLRHPVTAGLVRGSYNFIFGRRATPEEVASHLGDESAGALRKKLLDTEEFRQAMTELFPPRLPTPAEIDAPKTVFVHMLKTGGTTMRDLLRSIHGDERTCPEHFNGLHCYRVGDLARYRLFAGHFSLQSCDLIPGPKRIFTLLRHPVKILTSFYNFARAHSEEVIERDEFSLAAMARGQVDMLGFFSLEAVRRHPFMNNMMVRLLSKSLSGDAWVRHEMPETDVDAMGLVPAAKENLRSLLTFGILERYDESVELIFHVLGLPVPAVIERKNAFADLADTALGIERMKPQEAGPAEMEALAPLVDADLLLYRFAVELFEENLKTMRSR